MDNRFIDLFVKRTSSGQPFELLPHWRAVNELAFQFDRDGRLPYDTFLLSTTKKSAKTEMNAVDTLVWGYTQEAPNDIQIAANDLEQSQGRVFGAIVGLLRNNPELAEGVDIGARQITLPNGTTITAIASEYAGAAGSNHGLVSYDELWGYTSERSRRLWEELTPVPTRRNSIRLITTYAGFTGESQLLEELYKLGVGREEHPDGQGVRLHPELPIYGNRAARIFCYWDHEPRCPWQTPQYYESQRRTLRPSTYLRLHENRWTTGAATFITEEMWDGAVNAAHRPVASRAEGSLYLGVDAATKHDNAAVVGVTWENGRLVLAFHRIWSPSAAEPLDIEATIESFLREMHDRHHVAEILVDPYQMHRSITTLKAAGLNIREFPQTSGNTTLMGQTMFDLLNGRNFVAYPAADLRQQALNTVAVESGRGFRIAKDKAFKKIDAIVALSMACVAAIEHQGANREPQIRALFDDDQMDEIRREQRRGSCARDW